MKICDTIIVIFFGIFLIQSFFLARLICANEHKDQATLQLQVIVLSSSDESIPTSVEYVWEDGIEYKRISF